MNEKTPAIGEIRVILPDGNPFNPWFAAGDACRALDIKFTPEMSRKDARLVEWATQKKLAATLAEDEFFSADFDEALAIIDYFVKITTATLPPEYLNRIADKQD